ncbi:MAG TPA: STAS domain-containing protein [Acidimicrobiia bacterium]|jgi:anti-sigma B factor antagonist
MQLLEIELTRRSSAPVLQVKGEIDIATADQLRDALLEVLSAEPTVAVDMSGVVFIDASGLRVLLEAAASLNGSGPLTLIDAPLVARLLTLIGLEGTPSIELRDGGGAHG